MDQNLKKQIILEHYQYPKNKGLIDDNSYIKINTNNESCVDELDIMVKFDRGKVVDIRYDGEACAICTSSASIMTDTLIGKTKDEVIFILNNFSNMINEKEYDEDVLEEAVVYNDIYLQPSRKKCALLPWWGIEKAINKETNK